jgi:hypothetical protein
MRGLAQVQRVLVIGIAALGMTTTRFDGGRPSLAVEVAGLEHESRKPLLVMGAGGQSSYGCEHANAELLDRTGGRFILYEDGFVVFTHTRSSHCEERQAKLSAADARAMVDRFLGWGFASLPYRHYASSHTHSSGASIMIREGTVWRCARMGGVTRFGEPYDYPEEPPHPVFLAILAELAWFDPPGSAPWAAEEFRLWLGPPDRFPAANGLPTQPWPTALPKPRLAAGQREATPIFAMTDLLAAQSVTFPQWGPAIVELEGRRWGYGHPFPVEPAHKYIESVERAIAEREHQFYLQGWHIPFNP